jgi:site-specific DNA-methyltransferase (adenine-specific)
MTSLQLFNADCLEQMTLIQDKSIDLIICDLPYGCLKTPRAQLKKGILVREPLEKNAWDIKINLDAFWIQVKRIRKNDNTPCIHFCNTKFGIDLINSNPDEFRYDLVWNKGQASEFLSVNRKPMSSHEMIYIFSKKSANYNRLDLDKIPKCVVSVIDVKPVKISKTIKEKHPTQKPIGIYKWLIERYSNPNDVVLDPTFGSCTSGFVCRELNRNYIGIESNKDFFYKALNELTSE